MQLEVEVIAIIVGVLGIIVGVVVSFMFYRKSLRVKEPLWAIRSNNIIADYSETHENLTILYNKESVENLTVSKVLFWNNGAETIHRTDLETMNPLRIEGINETRILDATVLVGNHHSSQLQINAEDEGRSARINFDYLDKDKGGVFQIIHTGTSSQDLDLLGDIKGLEKIRKKGLTPLWVKIAGISRITNKLSRRTLKIMLILIGSAYTALGFIGMISPATLSWLERDCKTEPPNLFLMFIVFLGGIFFLYVGLSSGRLIAPKGLEIFHED